MEGSSEIRHLPEACVSHVLSFTSPCDVCRLGLVSVTFCSAAESGSVWSRFLPSNLSDILSQAVHPVVFSSLRDLYFRLCESILIDGGRKIFSLEKRSGAKCCTMCARDLSIAWGDDERYWRWNSHPDSRFAEVAELSRVCWLDVSGTIDSKDLSPNTIYKAYLIFKLTPYSNGLAGSTSVSIGGYVSERKVCLHPNINIDGILVPHARNDGWMEIEMGEFFNEDRSDGMVSMGFREVERLYQKSGLIVEGIQVRPK